MDIEESDDDRHLGPVHARGRDSSSHPDDQNHSTSTDLNRLVTISMEGFPHTRSLKIVKI